MAKSFATQSRSVSSRTTDAFSLNSSAGKGSTDTKANRKTQNPFAHKKESLLDRFPSVSFVIDMA